MKTLRDDFKQQDAVKFSLPVPRVALNAMQAISEIAGTDELCTAGGFPRGLYMMQKFSIKPEMNDIDVFLNLKASDFQKIRPDIEAAFGHAVRYHLGIFEDDKYERGLIEFQLPSEISSQTAGAKTLQIVFGENLDWSDPYKYLQSSNVGINQIAIDNSGQVLASPLFVSDMNNRTMTMNDNVTWSYRNWKKTIEKAERMQKERAEFAGWTFIETPQPDIQTSGRFWDEQQKIKSAPQMKFR